MSSVTKKMTLLAAANAWLDQVEVKDAKKDSQTMYNAMSATLSPVFLFQGTDPNGKEQLTGENGKQLLTGAVDAPWLENTDEYWHKLKGGMTSQHDGRGDLFVNAICAANGNSRWQVATVENRDAADRWAGKKQGFKNNRVWAKNYDQSMRRPGKEWLGYIFSTGNEDDNGGNQGKGDGNLRLKDGDPDRTKLNHPKNGNYDLSEDLQGAMEDSLIWQYKNVHRKGNSQNYPEWTAVEYRRAGRNAEQNYPVYEAFYKLMANWHNAWSVYQLVVNPSPQAKSQAKAPCDKKDYAPTDEQFKKQSAHRAFSPNSMPDAELLKNFQTELNKRDGGRHRVAGVWEGGFDAGMYVARATLDLSRAEKCLRKDVEAADQYLRNGGFDAETMKSFWGNLQKLASVNSDEDEHLGWLVDLAGENKKNPTVGSKPSEKPVEQCPTEKPTEAETAKTSEKTDGEDKNTGLGTGCIVAIVLLSVAGLSGIVVLCLLFCASSSSPSDDL